VTISSRIEASESTSHTLLERVRRHEAAAWWRFAELYGPLVYRWSVANGVSEHDAADVMQDVLQAVFQDLDRFQRRSPADSLRGWLWSITRNKVCDHFRRRRVEPSAAGGTAANQQLHEIPNPPELLGEPAEAVDAEITHRALELLQTEFESTTWRAFLATAVDGRPAADVALDLGLTTTAVYKAKSRVLLRLRRELDGLVD
jgi:RNA polymerase sigma-70 factor (ECF subfamily)